ncbi:MAG: Fic family protein [bacterium]|nr:Fic family protein [bacterium]MDT8395815.1 Fic family protein [bacterium]
MIHDHVFKITPEILKLIAGIDEFKGRWIMLEHLPPDAVAGLRRVAFIESVGSSTRIEGARLTDAQVESLLSGLDTISFRSRDEEEVAGYAEAMNTVFDSWEHIPLDENHIRQLHGIGLRYSVRDAPHRGEYKKHPNHVEAFDKEGNSLGVVFETATPFDTPGLMGRLVESVNQAFDQDDLHPLLVIAAFVIHFLAIHPFQDGNGRLSRILTTLLLLRNGYGYVPYSSLERVVEENKDEYYRALRSSQSGIRTGDENLDNWILFFLKALKAQKDNLARKLNREKELDRIPALSSRIIQVIRERGRLTMAEAVTVTGANRNTLKVHFRRLAKQGRLEQHGTGKGTWYSMPRR